MSEPTDLDDATADALLSGAGQDLDPELAAAVLAIRGLGTSTPPAPSDELVQLMATAPKRPNARRTWRWQAKIGAAGAVFIAATGGLATAHALPAPMQDAISHLGIGRPAHSHPSGSDAPAPKGGGTPDAVGRSYHAPGSGPAIVGATTTTLARPASPQDAVPSAAAVGSDPNGCAARAKHAAAVSGVSGAQACAAPTSVPPASTAPVTTPSTTTPTTGTSARANAKSNAGGNATSNAGGNGKSNAGGDASTAGGNAKSHAGGNGKSNAGGNGKAKAAS